MTFIGDIVSTYVHAAEVSAIKEMATLSARTPDSISLSWGLPSFRTPEHIRRGISRALEEDPDIGKYTLPDGLQALRELVVACHRRKTGISVDADANVMIGAGNMQGLNTLFHTMLDPGDEIILTDPCFASHIQQITLFDGRAVFWPLREDTGWSLDVGQLPGLITGRTQAIVIVSPSNPTGKVFSESDLRRVGEIAVENDILVIIDDPYSDFVYDDADDYFELASVESLRDHLVYLYSFSKSYAMSGWRLCYMIMPAELKHEAMKVHDATMICAPRISQLAGMIALSEPPHHRQHFMETMSRRRELICQRLDRLSHVFEYRKPDGAYYVFPRILADHDNSRDFAISLLEQTGIAVTPGSAFGPSGEHHVRMAYCVGDDDINIAFDRMERIYTTDRVDT